MPLGCLARPFQAYKTKVTPINHDPSRGTLSPRYDGFFPMVVYKAGICQKINWWVHGYHLFYLFWPLGLYKLGVQRCSLKTYCRCLEQATVGTRAVVKRNTVYNCNVISIISMSFIIAGLYLWRIFIKLSQIFVEKSGILIEL